MKLEKFVKKLLDNSQTRNDLARWGFSNQIVSLENESQDIYTEKGSLLFLTLPEGKVVIKQQKTTDVEAENLARKKEVFPDNYPQVYSHGDGYLIMQFVWGIRAWDNVLVGQDIPLEQMVEHMARIHNLSQRQLASGVLKFKPKDYAKYNSSKFKKHLGTIVDFDFEDAYQDLVRVVNPILSTYSHVEHVDANLYNWINLVKIDETNNTTSVPHMTLKSMLEYGPMKLDDSKLNILYQNYCKATSRNFDEFMEVNPHANVVFHLNKVFRIVRYLEKAVEDDNESKLVELGGHVSNIERSLDTLRLAGHELSGLNKFHNRMTQHCQRRAWI